jgi:hypothetical protein
MTVNRRQVRGRGRREARHPALIKGERARPTGETEDSEGNRKVPSGGSADPVALYKEQRQGRHADGYVKKEDVCTG